MDSVAANTELNIRFRKQDGDGAVDLQRTKRVRPPASEAAVDRLPPHSIQAEAGVLSCVLISPNECMGECIERFGGHGSAVFYDLRHQTIFDAFVDMFDRRVAIDVITLQQNLKDKHLLEQVGGIAYLSSLPDVAPSATNLSYYLELLWEKFELRSLIHTCTDVVSRVYEFTGPLDELMECAERDLLKAFSLDSTALKHLNIKEAVRAAISHIEKLHTSGGSIGIPTGLADLDRLTCGLHSPDMVVIAGRPSTGKTSLAMNIAEHVSVDLGIPVGVFSMEMSTEALVVRMLCSRARVNAQDVRRGYLVIDDFKKLAVASTKISTAPLYIDDTPALTLTMFRSKILRMHQLYGIKLAVIDYLGLMRSGGKRKAESRQQEVADISSGVKAIAKDLGIPIIVLAQLNRDMEKGAGKKSAVRKPRMSDLRESGSIEQDADVIGLLWKPEGEDDDDDSSDAVLEELVIAKQRNGPTGDIPLTFLKNFTRFENAARGGI